MHRRGVRPSRSSAVGPHEACCFGSGCARTDEAGFGSGCARTDEAGFGSGCARTDEAGFGSGCARTDEAGFGSGCARTDEAGFGSGCARTDEAGFGSGCARTDEAGFGSSPAAYGVDGEAGRVDRAGVNGVVSPPRQAWSGCGLGAGRWCESTARRTPRWPSRTCAALERHSPRLETVRLILRQQQAGPPPVCPPVAGVRPELARIAVPTPTLSAYVRSGRIGFGSDQRCSE